MGTTLHCKKSTILDLREADAPMPQHNLYRRNLTKNATINSLSESTNTDWKLMSWNCHKANKPSFTTWLSHLQVFSPFGIFLFVFGLGGMCVGFCLFVGFIWFLILFLIGKGKRDLKKISLNKIMLFWTAAFYYCSEYTSLTRIRLFSKLARETSILMVYSKYPSNNELYCAHASMYMLVSTHKYGKNMQHIYTYHK